MTRRRRESRRQNARVSRLAAIMGYWTNRICDLSSNLALWRALSRLWQPPSTAAPKTKRRSRPPRRKIESPTTGQANPATAKVGSSVPIRGRCWPVIKPLNPAVRNKPRRSTTTVQCNRPSAKHPPVRSLRRRAADHRSMRIQTAPTSRNASTKTKTMADRKPGDRADHTRRRHSSKSMPKARWRQPKCPVEYSIPNWDAKPPKDR